MIRSDSTNRKEFFMSFNEIYNSDRTKWFPKEEFKKGVAFGLMGSLASPLIDTIVLKTTEKLFKEKPNTGRFHQNVNLFSNVKRPLFKNLAKVATNAKVVLIAPALEEIIFRGLLVREIKQYQEEQGIDKDSKKAKNKALALDASAFSLSHFNPKQCVKNNTRVMTATFLAGGVYHLLAEKTGCLWAPFVAHSGNNALALMLRKK